MGLELLTSTDKECVVAYARSNMSVRKAGEFVHLNTNTVDYHLVKVLNKTGKNPKKFFELIELLEQFGELKRQGGNTDADRK